MKAPQKPSQPPHLADRLLEWFCAPHLFEEIQGDLHEEFAYQVERIGERRARLRYWREVLGFVKPFAIRRKTNDYATPSAIDMLRNYLTIAFRNLRRHKAFTALNIVGLAIGIATCLVILLFVQNELSYDRFHTKADRIVRVVFRGTINGEKMREANVMPPVAQTLKADYPEVQEATRLRISYAPLISYGEKTFKENLVAYADSNFFEVFSFPFLQGDPQTALKEPNALVITQVAAQKYFGDTDPIGKILYFKKDNQRFTVTGVIKNLPVNAHFHSDFFASMATLPEAKGTSWLQSNFYTYLVLPDGYDYRQLEAKLPQAIEKYMGPQLQQAMGISLAQFRQKGNDIGLFLQPLTDIHLRSDFYDGLEAGGDIRYVYIFSAIALFMLLIACINFMNLSTAGAARRAREVGVRKVLGSVKGELIRQFLFESALLTAFALLLALGLVYFSLPFFNNLTGKTLNLDWLTQPWLIPGLLLFGLLISVLAGSYPAFFLSSFKPVSVLKGTQMAGTSRGTFLRKGLVIFQFFISIALMVGTGVVYQQLSYIQHKKLGYDKDQVLVLRETHVLGKNEEVLRRQLLQDPRVSSVSISAYLPVGPTNNSRTMIWPGENNTQPVRTILYNVDDQYIPTMGMELVAGRNFSREFATDSSGVIINETAARTFGWTGNAVGKTISRTIDNQGNKANFRVIGVVEDFHVKSLHEPILPLTMVLGGNSGSLIVKAKTRDMANLLKSVKKQWAQMTDAAALEYAFLDESFAASYQTESRVGLILAVFAGLTIFVACLGLFGLATFTAEQRRKEIGIRKVVGASAGDIVALLSKDFLKLILLANLLAWPLVYYAMNRWLEDFPYRIDLSPWIFAVVGASALLIALLTVSFQAIKAALTNPVKSLRAE